MTDIVVVYTEDEDRDVLDSFNQLYKLLIDDYGDLNRIFRPREIPAGANRQQYLQEQVEKSDALVCLIGPAWSANSDAPDHFLRKNDNLTRIALRTAIRRQKIVIPVLFHGAEMPSKQQLPGVLSALADAQPIRAGRNVDLQSVEDAIVQAISNSPPITGSGLLSRLTPQRIFAGLAAAVVVMAGLAEFTGITLSDIVSAFGSSGTAEPTEVVQMDTPTPSGGVVAATSTSTLTLPPPSTATSTATNPPATPTRTPANTNPPPPTARQTEPAPPTSTLVPPTATPTRTPTREPTRTQTNTPTASVSGSGLLPTNIPGMVYVNARGGYQIDRSPLAAAQTLTAARQECQRRGLELQQFEDWQVAAELHPNQFSEAVNVEEWTFNVDGVNAAGSPLFIIIRKGGLEPRSSPGDDPANYEIPPSFRCVLRNAG